MQPPPGTPCANHADTPASATCGHCARPVCNSCVVFDSAGATTCVTCAAPKASGPATIAWERRAELGTLKAFVETTKVVLFAPQRAFPAHASPPPIGPSILFAIACHTLGGLATAFYQVAMVLLTTWDSGGGAGIGEVSLLTGMVVLSGPVSALGWMFVWGSVVHVCLLLFGAAQGGYSATVRLQGYASAAALCNVIPLMGGLVALVWAMVVQVLGLAGAHGASPGRTLVAVLTPVVVCCGGMGALFALMLFSVGSW